MNLPEWLKETNTDIAWGWRWCRAAGTLTCCYCWIINRSDSLENGLTTHLLKLNRSVVASVLLWPAETCHFSQPCRSVGDACAGLSLGRAGGLRWIMHRGTSLTRAGLLCGSLPQASL